MRSRAREALRPAAVAAVVTMAAIAAVAILLRFYDLSANPGGLYGDEAAEGLDAWRLLHQPGFHADFGVWFTTDGGREALFAYVVAGVFNFAGAGAVALRATAATFGVAGVLAIGYLARRFGIWTGVVAAAWAAGSLWLVCVSRDGMRNAIVPLFGAVALIALLRWAARPGHGTATVAGAVTSLAALYTYQPLKLLPVLVVVWLFWLRHADRPTYERLRAGAAPFAVTFILVAAPMIAVAVTNPTNYFGRAAAASALNLSVEADSNPAIHMLRTVAMFGFTGDPNARHDVAGLPLLPLPLSVVAAAGLIRLWRMRRDPSHSLILLALPVFLAAPLVATEGGSPHFLRALALAAPLGIAIGLGAVEIEEQVRRRWNRGASWVAMAAVAGTLTAVAVWSGWAYFTRPVADRYAAFSYPLVSLASYAADHPGSAVILDGYSAMDVEFLDASMPVAIYPPGSKVADPGAYPIFLALNRDDLASILGPQVAARAQPIAWDPAGKPAVWAVTP
jgi:4-amino-4-deoxy-L-arabinose transferase-like glycosyltransferase